MVEQVETLEDHAGDEALARDLDIGQFVQLVADAAIADQFAIDADRAVVDLLELVDAAQQRRLCLLYTSRCV